MDLRPLDSADVPAYQALRLRALREHPEAFSSSVEEEATLSHAEVASRIADPAQHNLMYGAFVDGALVGMVALHRTARPKTRHKAMIGAMYVAAELRGRGIGRALIDAVLRHARASDEIEDITLAVTVGNHAARKLYTDVGFVSYGVEPRYIKIGDRAHAVEWMILRLRRA